MLARLTNRMISFADASFGGDSANGRSSGGHLIWFNGAAILWCSNRQKMVTLSTAESETVQLSLLARALSYMVRLCSSMGMPQPLPLIVFEDNTAAIRISENGLSSARTKHMAVKELYIQEKVAEGLVGLFHCPSEDMLADMLTKGMEGQKFVFFRDTSLGYVSVKFRAPWFPRLDGRPRLHTPAPF